MKQQRVRRLERLVQEADAPPALRPRDQARDLLIAQVAEEGFRAAWDPGDAYMQMVFLEAFAQSSADEAREDPTPKRTAEAQHWREYLEQFKAAAEAERERQPRCPCSACATLEQAYRTRERS